MTITSGTIILKDLVGYCNSAIILPLF